MSVKIHKTAVIDKSAQIDTDVEIAPYAIIGKKVKIASGNFIGPHSYIEYAEIGKNNYFTASAFVGMAPQDLSYKGEETKIVIGDNNIIREAVSLHRGCAKTKITIIGNNCMFMANSHVGHDSRVGNDVVLVNSSGLSGHVIVEDKVTISGLVGIHQFTRIGTLAMIGAGSMVVMDILPYCRAQGDRAKLVGLNLIGMVRNSISRENIKQIKLAYKTLFMSGLLLEDALKKLQTQPMCSEVKNIVEFCQNSNRGLTRPRIRISTNE